jgi:NAD(P)-dependent dehydrogenase (short-subunit alcohol dehydrogenase family)
MAQAAAKAMKKRGGGAIVQTGSLWALQAIGATPSSAYSVANAGVHALVHNLALELAADKIRINADAPAVVETPIYSTFLSKDEVPKVLPTFNAFHPLGRIGQPGDVAGAIVVPRTIFRAPAKCENSTIGKSGDEICQSTAKIQTPYLMWWKTRTPLME